MNKRIYQWAAWPALVLLSGVGSVAYAADATPEAKGAPKIEEMIVTARKREERAIDTPVALAAMSAEEVERYNTRDLSELSQRLPGLSIQHGAGGGAGGNISIRGVGNLAVDYGADQPVALVLDGMSFTRGHVLDVGFFDVAGVEVLKGPQALYFGKNSPAGVLAITSMTPKIGAPVDGFFRTRYEFTSQDPVVEGGVSFTVSDNLAMRLAGRFQRMQGGYLKNTAKPIDPNPLYANTPLPTRGRSYNEYPRQRQDVWRLTTVWEPTDNIDVTMKNFYSHTQQDDAGLTVLYKCADGVGSHPYYVVFPDPTQTCTHGLKFKRNGALPNAAIVNAQRHLSAADRFGNDVTNLIHTVEANWKLNENFTLTSVTGYWDYKHREYTNYDYTSYAVVVSKQGESGKSFNQELRLQSNFGGPVNFMVGAFYERTNRSLDAPVQILPQLFLGSLVPYPVPGPYFGTYINYHQHWDNNIESKSFFASIDWKITDSLSLSGGARYTKEDRDSKGGNLFQNGLGFSPAGVMYTPEDSSHNLSPEVTLSWRPLDDLMVYASYKSGFQSAGISNPGTVPDLTALTKQQQTKALVFDQSEVDGYEVGAKGYFFDHRLSADISIYQYKYKALQVGIFNPVTTTFTIQNAAAATNKGIDFQTEFQALDSLSLRFAAQYNRLEFDSYKNAGCNAVDDGKPVDSLPSTGPGCHVNPSTGKKEQDLSGERYGGPPFQANAGFTWDNELITGWNVELSGDVIYHSKGQKLLRQPDTATPDYTVVNAAARFYQPDGPWQVGLVCSNCLNEAYATGIGNKPLGKTGDLTATIGIPRLVSLELSYSLK